MSIKQAIEALEQLVVAVQNATPDEGCEQSIAHARGMGEAAVQSLRSMPAEPVAWTVAGPVTNWSKDFSAYRTQHYVRPVFATPHTAPVPQGEPVLNLTLTRTEVEYIAAFVSAEDNEPTDDVVTLMVGNGHSGYGLYAVHPEYPEEGAVFVKSLYATPHTAPKVVSSNLPVVSKAVLSDASRVLEPYLGKDVPNKEVVLLDDLRAIERAVREEKP